MMMPVTAVNENGPLALLVGKIWCSRKTADILAISVTEEFEFLCDEQLRSGPALPHAGH